MRRASAVGLLFALTLSAAWVRAESPQDQGARVIPPGREAAARELLAPVLDTTSPELRWVGPSIEIDRIRWLLQRREQTRAALILLPRELGEAGDPTSRSFAIQVAWPPDVEPEPSERELLDAAVAAVQAGDEGQFYQVRLDLFEPQGQPAPPYQAPAEPDPSAVHRRWGLELGAVALLGLFALAVTLRPRGRVDASAP